MLGEILVIGNDPQLGLVVKSRTPTENGREALIVGGPTLNRRLHIIQHVGIFESATPRNPI